MPDTLINCGELTPAEVSDLASRDSHRIVGQIAKALAANAPFLNLLSGGTFPSGTSDEIRNIVQQQSAPGDSLAIPNFVCDRDLCGTVGHQDLTDTINYTTQLESFRGRGPQVCVKKGYSAFKGSYMMAEDSLKKLVTQYINADVRAQLYLRSASKFVANANYNFDSLFTGGNPTDLGVCFANLLPTGPMTFKALHYIARYLKEVLFAEWFDQGGAMPTFRFIGGSDQVEYFRNEIGVENIMCCLTTGGYKLGESVLTAYQWEKAAAYRGISFGIDQRPLRATGFKADGTLDVVDPVIIVCNAACNTAYAKANPAWLNADLEIGYLVAEGSFERLVPERYIGEGSFRFSPQLHMGELDWHYIIDSGCNMWGDYGWHKYQITRAYRPLRPEHVVPLLYKRCRADLGLVDCSEDSALSLSSEGCFVSVGECPPTSCPDVCNLVSNEGTVSNGVAPGHDCITGVGVGTV